MVIRDPLLGQVLNGRYRVDAVVARGGMAMVYRGTDMLLETVIGIKVMHGHLSADDTFVERFEREAENAARMEHPNLVSVHDQRRDGDVVYLVMEYLESVTLRKELKHRGRLTPRQAIVVTDAILAALEAVHDTGMIHRDLKPDNILLGTDGQIKLADFGLARAVTSATTTKTLIGTVGYVAPELVTRTGADNRTDLYTLGIMLYEMLTGALPYTDEVPIQVAYRHVHDRVPPPSDLLPGLSPKLDALVLWATSREPDDRPSDATALREALGELRSSLSDEALDFGLNEERQAGSPVLAATADIARPTEKPVVKEAKARTDEIPFVGTPSGQLHAAEEDDDDTAHEDGAASPSAAGAADEREHDSSAPLAPAAAGAAGIAGAAGATASAAAAGTTPRPTRRPWSRGSTAGAKRRRSAHRAAGITAAGLVVVLGGWSAVALTDPGQDDSAQQNARKQDAGADAQPQSDTRTLVPALQKGMKAADAIDSLKSAGLKPVQKDVYSTSVPAGAVIEAQPKAGTPLPAHSAVTVTVSKGEQLFPVPDVSGKSEGAAKSALDKAGLAVGSVSSKHSSSVSKGDVISQSANAGKKLKKGARVDLTVSKGPAPIAIPSVVGNSYGTAFGKLTNAGFRVAKEEVYSNSVPKGSVVSQYPRAAAERQSDALVFLKVSKGKKPDDAKDKKKDDKKPDQKKAAAKKKDAKAKKDAGAKGDAKKKKK